MSDYNSYIQTLSDGEYLVVEIGGVSDLEEAKEIIDQSGLKVYSAIQLKEAAELVAKLIQ